MNPANRARGILLFTVLFAIICIARYQHFVTALPYGMHDEAQADRLAVAMQFYDEGMNFFQPRTYNVYPVDRITGIEFPIHPYTAAALGFVFGRENISTCFRLLTLLITYFGLLALFLSSLRITRDSVSSLFIPLFVFCSPSFGYYACNYMPDVAAGSTAFAGIYFFLAYYYDGGHRNMVRAILLLTLAALMKATVGIVLLAVMGYTIFDVLFIKKMLQPQDRKKTFALFGMSLVMLGGYVMYNLYLTQKYHSYIFVLRVVPFKSWESAKLYFTYSLTHTFFNEYFVKLQYPVILLLLVAGIAMLLKTNKRLLWLLLILFEGCMSCTFIFGEQLIHHDYYFVSMWIPSIAIILHICFVAVRNRIHGKLPVIAFNILLVLVLVPTVLYSNRVLGDRISLDPVRYPDLVQYQSADWMVGGDKILDKLGIGRDSTIMVLDEQQANLGLVYFDRKGMHTPPDTWRGNIFNVRQYMMDYHTDIMVCRASKMDEIEKTYAPDFQRLFRRLYKDERCAVYYFTNGQ